MRICEKCQCDSCEYIRMLEKLTMEEAIFSKIQQPVGDNHVYQVY